MTRWDVPRTDRYLATRREFVRAISIRAGGLGLTVKTVGATPEEISRNQESIHQEVWLRAAPARIYFALTDSARFQQLTLLSAAAKSGMVKPGVAAQFSPTSAARLYCSEESLPGALLSWCRTSALSRRGERRK